MASTIIYTGAFRFPNGDAAAPRVLNNAKLLRKLGYNVIFVSWGGTPRKEDKDENGFYRYEGFEYINTYELDIKNNFFARIKNYIFKGKHALKYIVSNSVNKNIYAIVIYNTPIYFTLKIKQLCKKLKINLISDITEWYAPNELPGGLLAPPYWLNEINMRFIQKTIKNKILISSFLHQYYKSSNNIILPPLIDSNEKKWDKTETLVPPFNGVRLIYAGNPAKKDLLEIMLQAVLKSIDDGLKIQFIIVGVSKDQISHYSNFQKILSFPENFIICGKVPQEIVPAYYHSADFSIILRKQNKKNTAGFPTKLAESMMAGCPVITNNTSDISDYIKDGYNGYLISNASAKELQKLLIHVSKLSRRELDQMKIRAKETAKEKFDYSNHIEKMAAFITKIN